MRSGRQERGRGAAPSFPLLALLLLLVLVLVFGGLVVAPRIVPLPSELTADPPSSVVLLDRGGGLLEERRAPDGDARLAVPLGGIDPLLRRATLAAEDRRFFRHVGVDPLALGRAVVRSIARGAAVQGASTISMQTVRLARGRPHGAMARGVEVFWSLALDAQWGKDRILEAYLNRAPYGPRVTGAGAASRRYFGKPPAHLSLAEAALLAAMPRAPSRLDPLRHPERAQGARDAVIARMLRLGWVSESDAQRARSTPIDLVSAASGAAAETAAHHFAEVVLVDLAGAPAAARVRTTLDPALQAAAESALRARIEALRERHASSGAVVVLDTRSGELLALVGSPDFASKNAGQWNAALAPRQPGSAVKPFAYAAAFSSGLRPSTVLADVPASYRGPDGVFAPRNYAQRFSGPIPAREALANSYNVPTVEVIARTGIDRVAAVFRAFGLSCPEPERLGLGIGLGVGETSLLDLAAAYATLARGGERIAPRTILEARDAAGRPLPLDEPPPERAIDPISCAWVNEILSDPAARAAAFERGGPLEMEGRPMAGKTGTSSDWRDAWAVLYTTRHTVAVWMGNPDGSPMDEVVGVAGPAVVARDILERLESREPSPAFPVPQGIERRAVCPLSGRAAGKDCPQADWEPFRSSDPPLGPCDVHRGLRVDAATGLLARPCTPASRIHRMVFVDLPPRFALWRADEARPAPPAEATPCLCGSPACRPLDAPALGGDGRDGDGNVDGDGWGFAILRPIEGTILVIDPTLPPSQQQLALEAAMPPGERVEWRVDGARVATTGPGERAFWPLAAGDHQIEARALRPPGGAGRSSRFSGPPFRDVRTVRVLAGGERSGILP
ncbi:MAG: penicillin-binding protein 1C [Candidatus Eisenbacteria bacterium]